LSTTSDLEALFAFQLGLFGVEKPESEYRFHPQRRWRFDFAWPARKVACELEGGSWTKGRHTRGSGFAKDCEKYNAAAVRGWLVLRFTRQMVDDCTAVKMIEAVLKGAT